MMFGAKYTGIVCTVILLITDGNRSNSVSLDQPNTSSDRKSLLYFGTIVAIVEYMYQFHILK